jgi:hypothetical protein
MSATRRVSGNRHTDNPVNVLRSIGTNAECVFVPVFMDRPAHKDASASGCYDEESVHDDESPEAHNDESVSGAKF